jgi:hypothetical protein
VKMMAISTRSEFLNNCPLGTLCTGSELEHLFRGYKGKIILVLQVMLCSEQMLMNCGKYFESISLSEAMTKKINLKIAERINFINS